MWLEFITEPVNIWLSNAVRSRAIDVQHTPRVVHAPNLSNSRVSRYMWLSLADRQSRAFGMSLLFQRFYELVVSFPCDVLFYGIHGLLYQIALHYRLHWLMTRCVIKSSNFIYLIAWHLYHIDDTVRTCCDVSNVREKFGHVTCDQCTI